MWGFQRGCRLLATRLWTPQVPRAQLRSTPPENPLSPADQAIAISMMFVSFLAPTAWILAHIEDYKSRPE